MKRRYEILGYVLGFFVVAIGAFALVAKLAGHAFSRMRRRAAT